MLKVITLITKFIVITLVALFFGSCNLNKLKSITGSGIITTEIRPVTSDFKNVIISSGLDLEIEQSDKLEVRVVTDDNIQKDIFTKIENGVLTISSEVGSYHEVTLKKVFVKMPIIEGLEATTAGTIKSNNTLKGANLTLSTSSAGYTDITVEYETLQLSSSSAGTLNIKGKAIHLEASSSSGSAINAGDLLVNDVTAKASSGSSILVSPIVNLKAHASSGGNITYNKVPKRLQKEESSGGNVYKK
jgi:hypothetical protein